MLLEIRIFSQLFKWRTFQKHTHRERNTHIRKHFISIKASTFIFKFNYFRITKFKSQIQQKYDDEGIHQFLSSSTVFTFFTESNGYWNIFATCTWDFNEITFSVAPKNGYDVEKEYQYRLSEKSVQHTFMRTLNVSTVCRHEKRGNVRSKENCTEQRISSATWIESKQTVERWAFIAPVYFKVPSFPCAKIVGHDVDTKVRWVIIHFQWTSQLNEFNYLTKVIFFVHKMIHLLMT